MSNMADALMLIRTARDGVDDPEMFSDVLAGFEASELRQVAMELAVLIDIAVKAESYERFEEIAEFLSAHGGW
jgi:hypothetical protein